MAAIGVKIVERKGGHRSPIYRVTAIMIFNKQDR